MKTIFFLIILSIAVFSKADTQYLYSTIDSSISQPVLTDTSEPREFWGLSETEWKRYQQIITSTPWSVWEHNATPLSLLAFYSQNEEERRRYARKEAELDQWREAAVVTWQQLYNEEREVVNRNLVNSLKDVAKHKTLSTLKKGDKVLVFIDINQCEKACKARSQKIISSQATSHLYFMGNRNENDIYQWAKNMQIPVKRVQEKNITLNTEKGEARQYGINLQTLYENDGIKTFFRHVTGVEEIL